MGDPRRFTPHFKGPAHPWQKERIEEEKSVLHDYGLKNKSEVWRISSKVKAFTQQAKTLIAATGTQAEREKEQLFQRLQRIGLIKPGAKLDDILSLTLRNMLDRRLQTIVCKKGLARSMKQARQFITHQHILVGQKIVSSPNYVVPIADEPSVSLIVHSSLSKADHPERVALPPKKSKKRPERRRFGDKRGRR